MHPRQHAGFAGNVPQFLRRPAIETFAFDNQIPDDLMPDFVEGFLEMFQGMALGSRRRSIGKQLLNELRLDLVGPLMALLLDIVLLGLAKFPIRIAAKHFQEGIFRRRDEFDGFRADFLAQFQLQFAKRGDVLMGEHDRIDHLGFGDLLAEAFDHQHGILAARDHEVQRTVFDLLVGGHQDQIAINHPHPDPGNWSLEGNGGNHQAKPTPR